MKHIKIHCKLTLNSRKIYPKNGWLHPYKQTNSVDSTVGITDEIHKTLFFNDSRRLRRRRKHTLYKPLPRMVWVISQTGIWQSIHCRVPGNGEPTRFYPIERCTGWNQSGGHTLLWHHIQYLWGIAPSTENRDRADCTKIYGLLAEMKPRNDERMGILYHSAMGEDFFTAGRYWIGFAMLLQHRKCR